MSNKAAPEGNIRKKSVIREWIESIVVAFVLAMVIRTFVIQAFKIPTGSMRPTLVEGDLILVNKFIYGAKIPFTNFNLPAIRQPKRGDVIVFIFPQNPKKDFIKRLVAVENDTIEIKSGTVYIDGKPLSDNVFTQRYYYNRGEFAKEKQAVRLPEGAVFVLGDNSASSQDSRYWGFVPRKNILGKALVIYWPPHRIRIIK